MNTNEVTADLAAVEDVFAQIAKLAGTFGPSIAAAVATGGMGGIVGAITTVATHLDTIGAAIMQIKGDISAISATLHGTQAAPAAPAQAAAAAPAQAPAHS